MQALFKLHGASRADFEQAQKLLLSAVPELAEMRRTCTSGDLKDDYSLGFDLEANRGELGPAPPRVVAPIPLDDVWDQMQALLNHLSLVCQLPKARLAAHSASCAHCHT